MNLQPDDPRLTAYALGELPENERAAVEAELQQSPECREAVDDIRRTAGRLSSELTAEPCPELSPAQKQAIAERLQPANVVPFPRRRTLTIAVAAMAACGVLVASWQLWGPASKDEPRVVANAVRPPQFNNPVTPVTRPNPPPIAQTVSTTPTVTPIASGPAVPPAPLATTVSTVPSVNPDQAKRDPAVAWAMVDDATYSNSQLSLATATKAPPILDALGQAQKIAANTPADGSTSLMKQEDQRGQLSVQNSVVTDPAAEKAAFRFGTVDASSSVHSVDIKGWNNVTPAQQQSSASTTVPQVTVTAGTPPAAAPQGTITAGTTPNSTSLGWGRGGGGGAGGAGGGGGNLGGYGGGGRGRGGAAGPSAGGGAAPQIYYRESRTRSIALLESADRAVTDSWDGRDKNLGDVPMVGRLYRSVSPAETASYPRLIDNSFETARNSPLSTFSIDVDTASYANVRRFLNQRRLPPRDAVRVEELMNYFTYQYAPPKSDVPFAATIEVAGCPWDSEHRLVRVGIKGKEIARDKRPPSNFVFLIDVSGSMKPNERLPLIKDALRQLVKKMNENDRVGIVVYASEAGVRLESTSCAKKERILQVIDELEAGGSTNGGDGIRQAYRLAEEHIIREGVNRVLLCTDGDFNVGITDQDELVRMIQDKAKSGVFLTILGVGTDNYKDALMQKLADRGNGNYHYLDSIEEGQKVLIEQMNGTLVTIAKDVKIQIEFNPAQVNAYRLIGYEKRLLHQEDFNNDAKDAGEIGAGHTVTALYEIVPAGKEIEASSAVDDLKYQAVIDEKPVRYVVGNKEFSKELLTLKLRYKQPDGDRSKLLEVPVTDNGKRFSGASNDFKFAAAVAAFGMLLRESEYKGNASYSTVLEWAESSKGPDEEGYRAEFLNLVRKARELR